jgi:hypothetical protein
VPRGPYVKCFTDIDSPEWRSLSPPAQAWFARLEKSKPTEDGTVAQLRSPTEARHLAIRRALGIDPRYTKMLREPIAELLRSGFVVVDDDRLRLPNWERRQAWRSGAVPSPCVALHDHEPEEVGSHSAPFRQSFGSHSAPTSTQEGRPVEGNDAESFDPVAQNASYSSNSASRSKSSPARGNRGAGVTNPPTGQDPHHGEHVDERTGEVIDIDDFRDPPPEEREAEAAAIPHGGPTPEEADEATGLFDEAEEEGAL